MKHHKETVNHSILSKLSHRFYQTNKAVRLLKSEESGKGASVGKMSREKGKRYEREIAGVLREYGYDARRTAQNCGKSGDAADVVGLDGIHIECKHQEQIKIYDWMAQATRDSSGTGRKPAVFFRKNHCETLVTMKLTDWIELYREWNNGNI